MLSMAVLLTGLVASASAASTPAKRQSPFYPAVFNTTFTAFAKATPATTYNMAGFGELGGFPVMYTVTQVTDSGLTPPFYGAMVRVENTFVGPCAIVNSVFTCGSSINNSNNDVGLFVIDTTYDLTLGRSLKVLLPPKQYSTPKPVFEIADVVSTGKKVLNINAGSGAVAFVEFKTT